MTRVLVAAESVHTTAAACDYLVPRLDGDDEVLLLTVKTDELEARDAGDAANVARTRLVDPSVESITREGEPAAEIRPSPPRSPSTRFSSASTAATPRWRAIRRARRCARCLPRPNCRWSSSPSERCHYVT